jgi:hypothetical protein
MSTIKELIVKGSMWAYRKMYIKRLQEDGTYESDWLEISPSVISWGVLRKSFGDNIFLGDYDTDDLNIVLDNNVRRFDVSSIFNGFKTRFRTKFKVEIGLYDTDGRTEVHGNTSYWILFREPEVNDQGEISFQLTSTLGVLKNYTAFGVSNNTSTTAQMVDRIVKREISGNRIFDQYFEGVNDAAKYQINATGAHTIVNPSVPASKTSWDKIKEYSLFQNSFAYVNQSGNFVWENRDPTGAIQWYFNGAGNFYDNDFGVNIVAIPREVAGRDNTFTRVVCEYAVDTFYTAEESWIPGDLSNTDLYGQRTFNYEALELSLSEANTVSDALLAAIKTPLKRWDVITTFIPQLELKDKVVLNYVGEDIITPAFKLDISLLSDTRTNTAYDPLGNFAGSINLKNVEAKIIEMAVNMDTFLCEYVCEEI